MAWLIETLLRYPRRSALVAGCLLIVGGGWAWWQFGWQNPQRVFLDMLANNLATPSVTRLVTAASGGQSIDQAVRLDAGAGVTDWLVTARQNGSTVTTESLGTHSTGYIRYTQIEGSAAAKAKAAAFRQVLNTWAKSDGKTDTQLQTLFDQTLLDITNAPTPPIANMPPDQRSQLLQFMHDERVFTPDYAHARRTTVAGRPAYTYAVKVNLAAYVRLMQSFAGDLELNSLDTVDPNQYAALAPLNITIAVDRWSHQLLQVAYPQSGFTQQYADWGSLQPVKLPAHTIPTTNLELRLETVSVTNG